MNKEFLRKYDDLRKSVAMLNDELASVAELAGEEIEGFKDDMSEEVRAHVKKVVSVAKEKGKELDEYAREKPWQMIAAFSAAALLIGLLTGYFKSKRD